MTPHHPFCCRIALCLIMAMALMTANRLLAQTPANNTLPVPENAPKSVFEDPRTKPGYTDPFCPGRIKVAAPVVQEGAPKPPADSCNELVLNGITGRRLAMINNQTFEVGESGKVKTSSGSVTVTVLEIREKSVVVKCGTNPERREIFMQQSKF